MASAGEEIVHPVLRHRGVFRKTAHDTSGELHLTKRLAPEAWFESHPLR